MMGPAAALRTRLIAALACLVRQRPGIHQRRERQQGGDEQQQQRGQEMTDRRWPKRSCACSFHEYWTDSTGVFLQKPGEGKQKSAEANGRAALGDRISREGFRAIPVSRRRFPGHENKSKKRTQFCGSGELTRCGQSLPDLVKRASFRCGANSDTGR